MTLEQAIKKYIKTAQELEKIPGQISDAETQYNIRLGSHPKDGGIHMNDVINIYENYKVFEGAVAKKEMLSQQISKLGEIIKPFIKAIGGRPIIYVDPGKAPRHNRKTWTIELKNDEVVFR